MLSYHRHSQKRTQKIGMMKYHEKSTLKQPILIMRPKLPVLQTIDRQGVESAT
jgi:hypothetical protein